MNKPTFHPFIKTSKPRVAGIGEVLWDLFPEGKQLGGAPANFSYHCQQLGAQANPISSLGDDNLGDEAIAELKKVGLDTSFLSLTKDKETGTVQVILDEHGKPSYTIKEDRAWDYLKMTSELEALGKKLNAVCFGSLSQRSPQSRQAIRDFVQSISGESLKIFDVNLRQSYYSKEIIEYSLGIANCLKVSDEELPVLAEFFHLSGNTQAQLAELCTTFELNLIAYTRGPDGSILITPEAIDDFPGRETKVVDTVGAGDSFTAALCMGFFKGWTLGEVNKFANDVAAFVCSQSGAMPTLSDSILDRIR